jgi:hypothetical protein
MIYFLMWSILGTFIFSTYIMLHRDDKEYNQLIYILVLLVSGPIVIFLNVALYVFLLLHARKLKKRINPS